MTPEVLAQVMEATWPAARAWRVGPWTIRDGAGGGKRVSAATADGAWSEADLPLAEAAMAAQGAPALFLIREGEAALDAALAERGYGIVDPVVAFACAAGSVARPPVMAAFAHWPPLFIARDLWAEAGIGAARQAVMERVTGPKTVILGRQADRCCGVAFVALSGRTAMLHALEIAPAFRRRGSARHILQAAAHWALDQGGDTLSVVVTQANAPARALYASLGMQAVGQYHYRQQK